MGHTPTELQIADGKSQQQIADLRQLFFEIFEV
jgi:hypothetical protein